MTVTGPYIIDDRETPRFRVNRTTMVDPDILEEERRNIFDRCWLYVGHESEIKQPHDFRTRKVGGRPVILTRDAEGRIQVFGNVCPHRGMQVETRPTGHGRFIKCFYHGWSFDSKGDLVALPDDAAYGPNFDRKNLCLPKPPQVDSYRGFVFLCWSKDTPDLRTYLGAATDYIDLAADQGEDEMLEIVPAMHQYSMRANWKLLVENSYDGYHALTTHHRYLEMVKDSGASLGLAFTAVPSRGHDLGNGHAVVAAVDISEGKAQGLGRAFTDQVAKEKHLIRRARLIARYGEGWVNRMFANRNLNIFPNFMLIDLVMGMTIRTFYPESPDYMEINAWSVMPPGLDEETHKQRMDNFLTFWGPAGLATPDDVEALERCQEGFRMHRDAPWNDISRGMNFEQPSGLHELQMRTFWRKWNELMTGDISALEVPLYQPRGRVALAR